MSNEEPPPLSPWVLPAIIFGVNAATLAVLGVLGILERLSPAVQFYFGAATFAFPLVVHLILKKRQSQ